MASRTALLAGLALLLLLAAGAPASAIPANGRDVRIPNAAGSPTDVSPAAAPAARVRGSAQLFENSLIWPGVAWPGRQQRQHQPPPPRQREETADRQFLHASLNSRPNVRHQSYSYTSAWRAGVTGGPAAAVETSTQRLLHADGEERSVLRKRLQVADGLRAAPAGPELVERSIKQVRLTAESL